MSTVHARLSLALAVSCLLLACGQQQPGPSPNRERATSQQERLEQLVERRTVRARAIGEGDAARKAARRELKRIRSIRGEELITGLTLLRYGSDGSGDPPDWQQNGPNATRVPNHDPAAVRAALKAIAEDRIVLTGAAKGSEISAGHIDPRVLTVLTELARTHQIVVNSLRLTHPRTVQDAYGNPVL